MGTYIILCKKIKPPQVNIYMNFHLFFCGKSGDIEVYEDTDPELLEHLLAICKICNVNLRIVKEEDP